MSRPYQAGVLKGHIPRVYVKVISSQEGVCVCIKVISNEVRGKGGGRGCQGHIKSEGGLGV